MLDYGALFMTASTQKKSSPLDSDPEAAFTLVELLVVLAIIGLIAALVAPQVLRYLGSARVETTRAQLKNIGSALELYYLDSGKYPSSDLGLSALVAAPGDGSVWNGPYLKGDAALKDAWGNKFAYEQAGEPLSILVKSFGRDGKPQGQGLDADLEFKVQ
jgi:general secretion pathway protein G